MDDTTKVTTYFWLPLQETANGFILKLFADHERVEFPVIKLYDNEVDNPEEEFEVLKENFPGLWKEIEAAGIDNSPRSEWKFLELKNKGLLHKIEIPLEFLVNFNENGKPKKRVVWPATLALWAGQPASNAGGAGGAGEQRVYEGFTEQHYELLGMVEQEVFEIAKSALHTADALIKEVDNDDFMLKPLNAIELFKTVFYQTSRTFDKVRGAMTLSVDKAQQALDDDFQVIRDGEIDTLASDIASGHYLLENDDEARDVIKVLGIKISREHQDEVEKRVEVAQRVWLYVELTKKYGKSMGQSVEVINGLFDEIPW